MKVDFNAGPSLYRKTQATRAEAAKGGFAAGKTDVAEFSRGTSATLDKSLVGAKASIQSEVYAPTNSARLAEIKQAIKDGSYHVSTEEIVNALLGD